MTDMEMKYHGIIHGKDTAGNK